MMSLVVWILVVKNFQPSLSNNGHEPEKSPRNTLLNILHQSGCTNKLLAHFAIDAARNNLPSATVNKRLQETVKYDPTQMAKWCVKNQISGKFFE